MKKLLAALLALAIALSLCACGGNGTETESVPDTSAGESSVPGPASEPDVSITEESSEEESMEESSEVIERTWPCVRGTYVQPGERQG